MADLRNPYETTAGPAPGGPEASLQVPTGRVIGIGEILALTFRIAGRGWAEFLIVGVVLGAALLGAYAFAFTHALDLLETIPFSELADQSDPPMDLLRDLALDLAPVLAAVVLGGALLIAYYSLFVTLRTDQIQSGAGTVDEALQRALTRLPIYCLVWIPAALMQTIGLVFCLIPGFILGLIFSFLTAIVALEGLGFGALGRAFNRASVTLLTNAFVMYAIIYSCGTGANYAMGIPLQMLLEYGGPIFPDTGNSLESVLGMLRDPKLLLLFVPTLLVMFATQTLYNVAAVIMWRNDASLAIGSPVQI